MKKSLLPFLFVLFFISAFSQGPDKYIVFFKDKSGTPYKIDSPSNYLSPRAIQRRTTQQIAVDSSDLPVNPSYLQQVANTGAIILCRSRWMNSATVETNDPSAVSAIGGFPFVKSMQKVYGAGLQRSKKEPVFEAARAMDSDPYYGPAFRQIEMLNGHLLHQLGHRGQGMVIAVLDAGFFNADQLNVFDTLFTTGRIKGTWDFVSNNSNVYDDDGHGTNVLSLMGGNVPGTLVGTAPDASYWLLRSEDAPTEYIIEEYNWVSAAEFADSVGADVINSSLGYTEFDASSQNHTYQDMDGNTTPVTIGADKAASKGILVVNSAGNSGNDPWTYIGAPADGDSVLAVGAVDSNEVYAAFSSIGPSSDGDIKPNVSAQGRSAFLAFTDGSYGYSSGTSFSSPITAGMATSLWSAFPQLGNMQIMDLIQRSADQYGNPDEYKGYGIPDFLKAYQQQMNAGVELTDPLTVFPNPFDQYLSIGFYAGPEKEASLQVLNLLGQEVFQAKATLDPYIFNTISIDPGAYPHGMYILHLQAGEQTFSTRIIKK